MHNKIILVSLISVVLLSTACDQPRKRLPVARTNPVYIETGYLSANACQCRSASQYYIYNTSNDNQKRTIDEIINDINSPNTQTLSRKFEIPAKGKKFLRCSPAVDSNNQCLRTYSWKVDGVVYAQSNVEPIQVASIGNTKQVLFNCRKECIETDGQSPFCLDADVSGGRDTKAGLSVIKALSKLNKGEVLTKEEVLGFFGRNIEPCNRTALSRNGDRIINSGDTCIISGKWGANNSAKIVLPAVITPRISTDQGFVLEFEPTRQPTVHFGTPGLDSTYGGTIRRLEYHKKRLVASTSKGCVSFKLEK